MKAGTKVAIAVTAWLLLLVPLWYNTILVSRAHLDLDVLQHYEKLSNDTIVAYIPIAVFGNELPDIALASQHVLNQRLELMRSDRRFTVQSECSPAVELCVTVRVGEADRLGLNSSSSNLEVELSPKTMIGGNAPEIVAILLFDHVYNDEVVPAPVAHEEVTVGYSPRYHLTFSLLSEGGATLDWEIAAALQKYMSSLVSSINTSIAKVTIDTQTGAFASLGCERKSLIDRSQLSTFVDFAEWSLASIVPYPTLNFVLYVPTSPLKIAKDIDQGSTNAFIIPQWGGIYITEPYDDAHFFRASDLRPVIQKFSTQLLALLGMREPNLDMIASKASPRVRLGKLSRAFTIKGLKQASASLGSLRRLAESMPLISIPKMVAERVDSAVSAIDNALASLRQSKLADAARYTAVAFESADKAFFDKHMVAQAFFPDEQKLAVYMPLIGPLCIVVFSCWFRYFKRRKERQSSAEKLAPRVAKQLPRAEQKATGAVLSPQSSEISPRSSVVGIQSGEVSPRSVVITPRSGEVSPRSIEVRPRSVESEPQDGEKIKFPTLELPEPGETKQQ